jgi:hemerythrin
MVANKEPVPLKGDAADPVRRVKLLSSLQVSHEAIDDDHRGLFEMVNGIINAIENDRDPGEKYPEFMRALTSHFRRDEKLLREIGCPRTDEHAAYHEDQIKTAEKLERRFGKDGGTPRQDFAEELVGFILAEILKGDLEFKSFLVEKKLKTRE